MKYIALTLLVFVFSLGGMTAKVIKNPVIEYSPTWMKISEIELTKEATVIHGTLNSMCSIINNSVLCDRKSGKNTNSCALRESMLMNQRLP